jgi:hypothetical protein
MSDKRTVIPVAIPTLHCYEKLARLCSFLDESSHGYIDVAFYILDNGGELRKHSAIDVISSLNSRTEIIVPPYNMGVGPSWNWFIKKLGRCIISNDDVLFSRNDIELFLQSAEANLESIIFDVAGSSGGLNVFWMNRPQKWLEMGGFDEAFAPAYFEDDDACRRLEMEGLPRVRVQLQDWSHDTSSTLRSGNGEYQKFHWCCFHRNQLYYVRKWGGLPGAEQFNKPFNAS